MLFMLHQLQNQNKKENNTNYYIRICYYYNYYGYWVRLQINYVKLKTFWAPKNSAGIVLINNNKKCEACSIIIINWLKRLRYSRCIFLKYFFPTASILPNSFFAVALCK